MGCIVCATRGGEDSRRTQEQAIEMARGRADELVFVFVADTSFTPPEQLALTELVADELARLGRRLLNIAASRAAEQGVAAQVIVRRGPVRSTLLALLSESCATTLVMGTPRAHAAGQAFSTEGAFAFADEVRAMGIEVVLVA